MFLLIKVVPRKNSSLYRMSFFAFYICQKFFIKNLNINKNK
nr:MAG TPA: hypothetical protein [Caudoviricetes sp.]